LLDGDTFAGIRTSSTIEALHARGLVPVSYNGKGYSRSLAVAAVNFES
jgi:hypothetical protein